MNWFTRLFGIAPAEHAPAKRMVEAAAATTSGGSRDEPGWRRLSADGTAGPNERDLTPMAQERMQKLAEYLWQSNVLANRLVELPLAYLLAEGVTLQSSDDEQQKILDRFWFDPINNWPAKLEGRVRALGLLGEQCYIANVNDVSGNVRLGYLDPRQIANVVLDPDNPEQPIGVVTKKDNRGQYHKYKVIVLGEDSELFTNRTAKIREEDFKDGECFLFQLNKFPNGSRGRSDLLGQMDWLDAYDEFLFNELDRIGDLRRFVWDIQIDGADEEMVKEFEENFVPPENNAAFVHNESVTLKPQSPTLNTAETSESARLLRNHVLGGSTFPEHWFGGGADANRAIGESMSEPTFKVYTARQQRLKMWLEEIGRYVLLKKAQAEGRSVDLADSEWHVTASFPELVNKDVTKFASALQTVVTALGMAIDKGLLTEETAVKVIANLAVRFGQDIDPVAELEAARTQREERKAAQAAEDAFRMQPEPDTSTNNADGGTLPATSQTAEDMDAQSKKMDASAINAYSMGIERIAKMGVEVPQEHIREIFDIPEPTAGAPLLTPTASKTPEEEAEEKAAAERKKNLNQPASQPAQQKDSQ